MFAFCSLVVLLQGPLLAHPPATTSFTTNTAVPPDSGLSVQILFPPNGLSHANPRGFNLRWQGGFDAYAVFLSPDSSALLPLITGTSDTSVFTGTLLPSTQYYWKVVAVAGGETETSTVYAFATDPPTLQSYKFIPSADSLAYDTESDSRVDTVLRSLDLGKVALFVTDFWAVTVDQYPEASQNIMTAIAHAREMGIPVFHLIHEGWQTPAVQPLPGERVVAINEYSVALDAELDQLGLTTLIYVGYGAAECVTLSRTNSIHRISDRAPGTYDIILLKDCTEGEREHDWAVNGVETRFYTSTLQDLLGALERSATVVPTVGQWSELPPYGINTTAGIGVSDFSSWALVMVNFWADHPNDGFSAKIQANVSRTRDVLAFARQRGMQVVHIPNGKEIDADVAPIEGEYVLEAVSTPAADKALLWSYLKDKGVTTLLVSGNFENTSTHFPLPDAWGFSTLNNSPQPYPNESAFNSFFLEDCIEAFEAPSTVGTGLFKRTYLSRAQWYQFTHSHRVTTKSVFRQQVNTAPEVISSPVLRGIVDSTYAYQVMATDPDTGTFHDMIRFRLVEAPAFLAIDSVTGRIEGNPTTADTGSHLVIVEASDDLGVTHDQSYTMTVVGANSAPVFVTVPVSEGTEDSLYIYAAYAVDADTATGDVVRYRVLEGPGWLTLDDSSGLLSGIPGHQDFGDTVVVLEAYDLAGDTDRQEFFVSLTHTNHLPVITAISDSVAFEDSLFTAQILASDLDVDDGEDTLRYQIVSGPPWLTLDSLTGTLSGTPAATDVGTMVLEVGVTDGSVPFSIFHFPFSILHTNHPPVFAGVPDTTTVEDELYQWQAYAADVDSALFGDLVRYRLTNAPSWLSIDSVTGLISGIPRVHHLPDTVVTVEAYDINPDTSHISPLTSHVSLLTSLQYPLRIAHINHDPQFVSLPTFTAQEDTLYRYQVVAMDPDTLVGDALSYTLTKRPSWLSVDSSGLVSGTPRGENVGDTTVTVRVIDGNGGIATQSWSIGVSHTNHAPEFFGAMDSVAMEDSLYEWRAYAFDTDSALFGDAVRYRLVDAPSWLSIDSLSGLISGSPSGLNAQDTIVTVMAYDEPGSAIFHSLFSILQYRLSIEHVNHPVEILSAPLTTAAEDSLYFYQVLAADADTLLWGDVVSFHTIFLPRWLSLDTLTGVVSGIPQATDVGDTVVSIRARDGFGSGADQTWPIRVLHTNHAPVIELLPDSLAFEDSLYLSSVSARDIDSSLFGDLVRYRLVSSPSWLSLDSISGVLTGTPRVWSLGDSILAVEAVDGKGGVASWAATLRVQGMNALPVIVSLPPTIAYEDSSYVGAVAVQDKEAQYGMEQLRYELVQAPSWIRIDSLTGILSGFPGPGDVDTATVTVRVIDQAGIPVDSTFTITVLHTNHPPIFSGTADTTAVEDQAYSWRAEASDPDSAIFGDVVRYRLVNAPSWLSIDSVTGLISGIPRVHNLPDTVVTVEAYDINPDTILHSLFSILSYPLRIAHINHVPVVVSFPAFSAAEDSLYQYQLIVHDPDTLVGDVLTFELTKRPNWLKVNSNGEIEGIPSGGDVGDTVATVRVDDGKGGVVTQSWTIGVSHTNHAPMFVTFPDTVAIEDSLYRSFGYARDADSALFGDRVRYRLIDPPSWLSIDSVSGLIIGTPSGLNAHDTVVTVMAYDEPGSAIFHSLFSILQFTLSIDHVNHPPAFNSTPPVRAIEDSVYVYHFTVEDVDVLYGRDSLTTRIVRGPDWLTVDSSGTALSGIPDWTSVGVDTVAFMVSDGENASDTQWWILTVEATIHAPAAVGAIEPTDSTVIRLVTPPQPIIFTWTSSSDGDPQDTIRYILHVSGGSYDSLFAPTTDTTITADIMGRLSVGTPYIWNVTVTDGHHLTSAAPAVYRTSHAITDVTASVAIPERYALHQNYPNPFNPSTTLQFDIPVESKVRVTIFSMLGQEVEVILDERLAPGVRTLQWNGASLPSGIYFAEMRSEPATASHSAYRHTIRMILLK